LPLDSQHPPEPILPGARAGLPVAPRAPLFGGLKFRTLLQQSFARVLPVLAPVVTLARPFISTVQTFLARAYAFLLPWAKAQPLWRFCTGSLSRRIFTANLAGLVILLSGFGVLTYQHTWLIDAKAESLRTQARMIAVAVASNAKMETETMVIDPDRLADGEKTFPIWRDETLDSLALDIAPERIAPILKKLILAGEVRVRIYNRESVKLVDTDGVLSTSRVERVPAVAVDAADQPQPSEKLRTAWTRVTAWIMRSPLQVYREIGAGKVTDYPEVREALGGQVTSVLLLNDKGEQIISVFAPVQRLKSIPAFVWLTTRPGDLENILWRERRPFFAFSLVALLTTLFASIMLNRTIGGPMKELATAAEHVSRNINARHEIPDLPGRRDEVGDMAAAYRNMTAALYRRIEASDRFAQDVAHELKNPVAAARSTAETMSYAKTDQKRDELVHQIQGELKRLNRLISDVSNASRLDAELALQEVEPVDVSVIATNITGVFRDIQKGRDDKACQIDLKLLPADAKTGVFVIDAHEGRLGQVLTNLLDNALSFSPTEGCVTVTIIAEAAAIIVRVDDEGPGIPPDKLDDVFKRFYSDRPQSDRVSAKNSGLGLSLSREIVEAHGGTLRAENRPAAPGQIVGGHDLPELACRRIPGVVGARFEARLPRSGRARR
jgi:two-component system, OmpR family, sensor histidine kinase ChvG